MNSYNKYNDNNNRITSIALNHVILQSSREKYTWYKHFMIHLKLKDIAILKEDDFS